MIYRFMLVLALGEIFLKIDVKLLLQLENVINVWRCLVNGDETTKLAKNIFFIGKFHILILTL